MPKTIPGFSSTSLYDYGSSDADLVVNWNNWNPNPLDSKTPMFYRALYPTYGAESRYKQEQTKNIPISEVKVGDITKKMGQDLMTMLEETVTLKATPATYTSGTRGFTLGVLLILMAFVGLIFARAN